MTKPMPTPKFSVGDKVKVPAGTQGAPPEWYEATGFVVDVGTQAMGPSLPMQWEPLYLVRDFDEHAGLVGIREAWLIRALPL